MGASSAIQLSFNLRTSSQCKTVHLLGSWDLYQGQLPLSRDSSRDGGWKGTFRFQDTTLQRGQRYWYYYIIDGYHVSHDPTQESTTEPTTCRTLNILDVPTSGSRAFSGPRINTAAANSRPKSSKISPMESPMRKRFSQNTPADIPLGRPVSRSAIYSPRPKKPNVASYITSPDCEADETVEQLARQFARYANVSPAGSTSSSSNGSFFSDCSSDIDSDFSSTPPSLAHSPISPASSFGPFSATSCDGSTASYMAAVRAPKHSSRSGSSRGSSSVSSSGRSSRRSSACPSTASSPTSSSCACERFGVTRKGGRVRLDCGGARCGYSSDEGSGSPLVCASPSLLAQGSALGLIGLGDVSEKWGVDLSSLPTGDRHGVVVRRRR